MEGKLKTYVQGHLKVQELRVSFMNLPSEEKAKIKRVMGNINFKKTRHILDREDERLKGLSEIESNEIVEGVLQFHTIEKVVQKKYYTKSGTFKYKTICLVLKSKHIKLQDKPVKVVVDLTNQTVLTVYLESTVTSLKAVGC